MDNHIKKIFVILLLVSCFSFLTLSNLSENNKGQNTNLTSYVKINDSADQENTYSVLKEVTIIKIIFIKAARMLLFGK
jgi:hypothetical protein